MGSGKPMVRKCAQHSHLTCQMEYQRSSQISPGQGTHGGAQLRTIQIQRFWTMPLLLSFLHRFAEFQELLKQAGLVRNLWPEPTHGRTQSLALEVHHTGSDASCHHKHSEGCTLQKAGSLKMDQREQSAPWTGIAGWLLPGSLLDLKRNINKIILKSKILTFTFQIWIITVNVIPYDSTLYSEMPSLSINWQQLWCISGSCSCSLWKSERQSSKS